MNNLPDFKAFFEAAPAPYLVLLPDTPHFTIAEANRSYCAITQSDRSDLVGKGLFEAFPENAETQSSDGGLNLRNSLEQVIATRASHKMDVQKYDIPVRGSEAFETRYWLPESFPVLDDQGEVSYIIHTTADVTNQMLAEATEKKTSEELLRSQEHYHSLFNNNPDAVFSFDLNGYFLSANQALTQMAECSMEEIMELTFVPFIDPQDLDRVFSHFERAGTGEIQNYNTRVITARGNRIIINVTNIPITVNREIVGVYGIAKDITASLRAEQQLKQSQNEMQKILDYSLDIICALDENRNFIKVNQACRKLWGYEPEELEGKSIFDIILEEDRKPTRIKSDKIKAGINAGPIENRIVCKDGRLVTMRWSSSWDTREKINYSVGRDVTAEKEAVEIIKNNEKRFQTLLKNSTDGLVLLSADGKFCEISETGKKIMGRVEWELIGRAGSELVHPDDHPIVNQAFKNAREQEKSLQSVEYRILMPCGNHKWIEGNFQNQLNEPSIKAIVNNFRDITERKKVQDILVGSEEMYRTLFQDNPLPMWIYDNTNFRFLKVNRAALFKYGYSEAEFLSMTIKDIRPEEDQEQFAEFHKVRSSYGNRYEGSWRHLKKNGELMYVDITSHLIDYQGRSASIILAVDITSKIQAEEAIKASEELRKLIMNSALDAVICMDIEGQVTLWSNQAENLFGWRREELIGKSLSEFIIPLPYRERHEAGLKNYLETGQGAFLNQIVEVTALDRNGIEFPIELTIVPVKQGESEFFCAFIRDITERNHFTTELKLREQHFKALVQEGSDLINILDEDGHYTYVSPTYISNFGIESETDLLGENVFNLIHEEDRQLVLESFNRLKSEKRVKTAPFRFKDGHGEYRWLESIGTNLLTDLAVKGIVVNSKDITERINYIKAIEEQNARLREISWIQSHIVRAPLCRIMGLVDLLTTYSAEDQEILFKALLTSAHELDEIIQDIVKKAEQLER